MRVRGVESTELFVGSIARPLQVIRVTLAAPAAVPGPVVVRIEGAGVTTPEPVGLRDLDPEVERVAEVAVEVAAPYTEGVARPVTVIVTAGPDRFETRDEITPFAAGWTMHMVSHFHYDPVWWNTQGGFTEAWYDLPVAEQRRDPQVRTAFDLVRLHLEAARRDPDYKFVLAEVDYLKPHWDAYPADRADLRRFIAAGRIEIVGGNYNEPNTNLTAVESTIRNAVYGIAFQREVIGGDPRTAWMLDVFGHDPAYPGLMADAGLTSTAWARGPYHQWGPKGTVGDNLRMQFPSEFEWISPSGRGLLTAYMAGHYGAGWSVERFATLEEAEMEALELFRSLRPVAATRNVLLPVGADHVIPSRWCTEIHRDWNKRYVWPRFVVAVPREFFAAVRGDAERERRVFSVQSRDMNPVYPGKDVSYIDTKQAQRAAETAVLDAERLATLAALLVPADPESSGRARRAGYPAEALDKAWRQLLFGAHHDAITGTESDQVYLDLLAGWREAYELGDTVRRAAMVHIARHVDTGGPGWPLIAVSTLSRQRDGLVRLPARFGPRGPSGIELRDDEDAPVPVLVEHVERHADGTISAATLTFRAVDVPALGFRLYRVVSDDHPAEGWTPIEGTAIENDAFLVESDPGRGGALIRILDRRTGDELLRPGSAGNELVVQEEYDNHPRWREGPWLLLPKGPGRGSTGVSARVRAERCAIGRRLVTTWALDELRVTQEVLLWDGADQVEFRTHVDGSIGRDRLLRVRFPFDLPGGLPLYEVGNAVVARAFGHPAADAADHAFTLDNPAYTWAGLGATVRVALADDDGRPRVHTAIGVAEVVAERAEEITADRADGHRHTAVHALVAALAARGVTATCSRPAGPRYGALDLDSNLPDVRIALGGPDENAFTAQVLAAADPAYATRLREQLARYGQARVWVPAARPRAETFDPSADVRGPRSLPVLVVAGRDLPAAIAALAADLDDATLEVTQPATLDDATEPVADRCVALLNRGTPGYVVEADGTLSLSLMRSCSGWPAGVWIAGPRRTAPDGSSFAWQHWSHTFHYALRSGRGDWRRAGLVTAGQAFNHDLLAELVPLRAGQPALPRRTSLAAVEPDTVVLTALKPRGTPLAAGRTDPVRVDEGVTLRCYESTGQPTRARVRCFTGIAAATVTDLVEQRERGPLPVENAAALVDVGAADAMTVVLRPPAPAARATDGGYDPLGPSDEPAQPVFTRYWLHNKGAAPFGNLPVSVHVSPSTHTLAPGDAAQIDVTVASGPSGARGRVEVVVPDGLVAEPGEGFGYELPPGEHAARAVTVRATGDPVPGTYFVAARIRDHLGQTLEDVAAIHVGPRDSTPGGVADSVGEPLAVTLETRSAAAGPGGSTEMVVRLTNRARSQARGEAQVVSPYGSWSAITLWDVGFAVDAGAEKALRFPIRVPEDARPGSHYWAVAKVSCFGRVYYTEALPLQVSDAGE